VFVCFRPTEITFNGFFAPIVGVFLCILLLWLMFCFSFLPPPRHIIFPGGFLLRFPSGQFFAPGFFLLLLIFFFFS